MTSWFKSLSVGTKIGFGFSVISLIFLVNILLVLNLFNKHEALHSRILNLRVPTAENSLAMLAGINRSLAATRGWLLLGEEHFKTERLRIWSEDIESSKNVLTKLSINWTNPDNIERFQSINKSLEVLKGYQIEVERLPRSSGGALANKIMSDKAAPMAFAINTLLGEMAGNQRKLLKVDLEEADRLAEYARKLIWTTLLVSITLSILIGYPITLSITRPLQRITEFSRKVASGKLNQKKLTKRADDEIGILTHNLNEMTFGLIASLKENEARNSALLHNIMDPLIEIDDQGIIEEFNPAAEKVFGYSASEVIGENVNMLMPEPYHSEHDRYLRNYQETGQAKIIGIGREVMGKRKDGSVFPTDLAVSEFKVGDKTMYVGVCRDITARKQAEQELADSRLILEKQHWLKAGLTELHDQMRGDQDEATLSQNIISYLADRLNMQTGMIYLSKNGEMQFAAGYAYNRGMDPSDHYHKAGGLVAQAALEKKSILVRDLPGDYLRIQSGLIDAPLRNLLVTPIVFEGEVIGVIELGSLDEILDDHREFLNEAMNAMAINLNSSLSRARLAEFLESQKLR